MNMDATAYFSKKPSGKPENLSGRLWIIQCDGPFRIGIDDIDKSLRPYLKRCTWQLDLHLEGAITPKSSAAFQALISGLIKDDNARIYDPQTNSVTNREGSENIIEIDTDHDAEVPFNLGILFERAERVDRAKMGKVLDIIEAELPEALPHRYGHFEPPQGRWNVGGRAAYLKAWQRRDVPFSLCKTPVTAMYMSCDYDPGHRTGQFRCGTLEFQLRPKLQANPRKFAAVIGMAERLIVELDGFYAGILRQHFCEGPFFAGLPQEPHLMLALGPPMLELWPEFDAVSQPLGTKHRAASLAGNGPPIIAPKPLCVPNASQAKSDNEPYAQLFPFPKTDPYS